jgi:hypothetical protein
VDDEDWTTVWEATVLQQPDETGIPLGIDSAFAQADAGYETYHFEPGTRYRVATSTPTGGRGLESFLPRDLRPGKVRDDAKWLSASEFYSRTRYC